MKASAITSVFAAVQEEDRAALIPYVTAGHPVGDSTATVLHALADSGADIIELGVPFSDPLADGPTIQGSSFSSLQNGTTVEDVLAELSTFRAERTTPVVLFTYLNPVLRYGLEDFLSDATECGASGLLLTDLPVGADGEVERAVAESPLDFIRLVAPTTREERVPEIAENGSGFLYYISRAGVTGARSQLRESLGDEVAALRSQVGLPVAVGFGISTPEQAREVGRTSDGVVIGSALVRIMDESGMEAGARFVARLRAALD